MIQLSEKSLRLLKKCLIAQNSLLILLIKDDSFTEYSGELYNELRDIVCDELLLHGLEDEKPTKYGLELENLIDEIGRLFM